VSPDFESMNYAMNPARERGEYPRENYHAEERIEDSKFEIRIFGFAIY